MASQRMDFTDEAVATAWSITVTVASTHRQWRGQGQRTDFKDNDNGLGSA